MRYTKEYYKNYRRDRLYTPVWRQVWRRDNGSCVLCFSKENICIDHILSVSKGGKHTYDNMRLLCRTCNTLEGHRGRILKNDEKNIKNRRALKKFREENPGYFTAKSNEFTRRNPGYHTKQELLYRALYIRAKEL